MDTIIKKVKMSHVVVKAGPELYHMECFRRDYGDDKTILHLSKHYQREDGMKPADAAIRAGHFLNDVEKLKEGAFKFKEARSSAAQNVEESVDIDCSVFHLQGA
jgi:hypothetical protein